MNARRDVVTEVVLGGLTGVALGLLFAPATGQETRTQLRREGNRLGDRAHHQVTRIAEQARRSADEVGDRIWVGANDVASRTQTAVSDTVERGRTVFRNRAGRLREAFESGRNATLRRVHIPLPR